MPTHTDIRTGDWIDRFLPERARPYARLMRLDRPIGTWLLLLPCWWSVALAADGMPDLWLLALFAFGALIMRGAGCVINDIYDRNFDRQVERTQTRPLASGALTLPAAILFLVLLLLIGLAILLQFNAPTVWLGAASLLLVFTYPLAKRITWWPQFVLGLAFNWGALMGWSAAKGSLGLAPVLLYIGGVFWTLAYDTIYAHQDKEDDLKIGIKSLALYLGENSRLWIAGFFDCALLFFALAGFAAGQGALFYIGLCGAFAHALWQVVTWEMDSPPNCLQRFRSNRDFGLLIFLAHLLGNIW